MSNKTIKKETELRELSCRKGILLPLREKKRVINFFLKD